MNKKRKTITTKKTRKSPDFNFESPDYVTSTLQDTQILNLLALQAPVKFASLLSEVKKQLVYMPENLKRKLWFDLEIEGQSAREVEKTIDQLVKANFLH